MRIAKLLIANRGEIACRIVRTARAMGLATVAVYSDPDAAAAHVEAADEAVALGGSSPAGSYLGGAALIAAAKRTGADAIHPGYGFLAENAAFAQACGDAGLVFVGPSPEVIARMGDKLAAKQALRDAGVPVLDSHRLETAGRLPAEPTGLAWPVVVKAVAGGGGRGMRVVHRHGDLPEALAGAAREAQAAFGDGRVFVEPYVRRPRHVEIQILGDTAGTVVHLGERECSLQRRFQKVVEESPSPAVDDDLRERMGRAATAAARAIGYTNAGTVEFLLDPEGRFSFLEVNTRLQVEHPVTELAWTVGDGDLDLVRLQLLVAAGEPLPFRQEDLAARAHAIEARLCAEDPARDFLPTAGTLTVWEPHLLPGIRVDDGVRAGTRLSEHYDPLIAKMIAAAPTRTEAARLLARSLEATRVHGPTTNRDFLVAALRHPAFLDGDLHTGFVDEHLPPERRTPPRDETLLREHAIAAALAGMRGRLRTRSVLPRVPTGWRNNRSQPERVTYTTGDAEVGVGYQLRRDGRWLVDVDGRAHHVTVHAWPDERGDGALDVDIDGLRRRVVVTVDGDRALVDSPGGHSVLGVKPRFPPPHHERVPGGLTAPLPGTVAAVAVDVGAPVAPGDLLVVISAMKMEHRVVAPAAGTVTDVRVAPHDTVEAEDVLVVVDAPAEDDGSGNGLGGAPPDRD